MTAYSHRRRGAPLTEADEIHVLALYAAGAVSADTAKTLKEIELARFSRGRLRGRQILPYRIGVLCDRELACKTTRTRKGIAPKAIRYWLTAAGEACARYLDAEDAGAPIADLARRIA